MRVLAIHGVGHADAQTDWQAGWRRAVEDGLARWESRGEPELHFLAYDHFFEQHELHAGVVIEAFGRLVASGLFHGLADVFRNRRGIGDTLESVRWTAGMVAQWTALEALRAQLRRHLGDAMRELEPDVVLAHSLGSLIAYDTLKQDETANGAAALIQGRTLVTLGSQIGNPAVRATFGGRVEALARARFWWHLFNEEDDVFTAPIELPALDRFRQVETRFELDRWGDHDGVCYLAHEETSRTVWQDLAAPRGRGLAARRRAPVAPAAPREAQRRALLVGIADYVNPVDRLDGPVNDVFNMSATLQELGFPADNIRIVLNERATTAGIRERLRWLLADAKPGDSLFFHYAGHGAQVPGYGQDAEVDRIDECLVPYDFDWSQQRAITDDEFCALYSQLPYDAEFVAVLDCCHSGGMTRAGSLKSRAVTPPDDVRHRMMRWDAGLQMWLPRERFGTSRGGARGKRAGLKRKEDLEAWVGRSGGVRKLGRATSLWSSSDGKFRAAKEANGHRGPYAPILYEACAESESAYEYRHGVTSHGAFSYALCEALRDATRGPGRRRTLPTFRRLLEEARTRVRAVVSEPQTPQLVCPAVRLGRRFPGTTASAKSGAKRRR